MRWGCCQGGALFGEDGQSWGSAPGSAAICCAALSCCLDLAICKMGCVEDHISRPSPGDGESLLKLSAVQSIAERLWGA